MRALVATEVPRDSCAVLIKQPTDELTATTRRPTRRLDSCPTIIRLHAKRRTVKDKQGVVKTEYVNPDGWSCPYPAPVKVPAYSSIVIEPT